MAKATGTSLPALAASSVLRLIPCSSFICQRPGNPQLSFARSLQAASPCINTLFRSHARDDSSLSLSPRRRLCARKSARASSADVSVVDAPGVDSPFHASSADAHQAGENGTAAAAYSTALTFQDAIQRLQECCGKQGCAVLQPGNSEVGLAQRLHQGVPENVREEFLDCDGPPATVAAGQHVEDSWLLPLARRQAMSVPVLVAALAVFPWAATGEENGFFLYEDQDKGFSLLVPTTWTQKEKAGATALFEDPERKSTNVGVVVNPVRINSLKDFGTLEFVAEKLLAAETRKESTKAASIITSGASEKGPDKTLYYNFEYSLESTRGNKRLLTTVAVARRQLFILNIALPEGLLDAPSTTGGRDTLLEELERVQESFQVL